MRTMLKVQLDVDAANRAVRNGDLPKLIESTIARLKPEAAYFLPEDGKRTAYFFFDLKNAHEIPGIAEPFFETLKAEVRILPVMNAEDLRAGLQKI
jgi:hypothetical protein